MPADVLHYAAFTSDPTGGNPAGVVLDAGGLSAARMQAIAADLGYSESVFLSARPEQGEYDVRYFSPQAEVPFCGHATVAAGVALADHHPEVTSVLLHTVAGPVPVRMSHDGGQPTATLTSVPPYVGPADPALVAAVLGHLGWDADELATDLPPRLAFAGARHLILCSRTRERLAEVDYDFAAVRQLMLDHDLTTVALVWREDETTFSARNLFPVGGVVEDPATGAAAAAFGAYLRDLGALSAPIEITIHQGVDLGRPSLLRVMVDVAERPELQVSGAAIPIPPASAAGRIS